MNGWTDGWIVCKETPFTAGKISASWNQGQRASI